MGVVRKEWVSESLIGQMKVESQLSAMPEVISSRCPLLAQSRRVTRADECPLLGGIEDIAPTTCHVAL